jgi:hypothetical protein
MIIETSLKSIDKLDGKYVEGIDELKMNVFESFFFFNENEYGFLFIIRQRGLPNPYIIDQS